MICPRNVYKKQRAKTNKQTNKGPYLVILSQLETSIASSKGHRAAELDTTEAT